MVMKIWKYIRSWPISTTDGDIGCPKICLKILRLTKQVPVKYSQIFTVNKFITVSKYFTESFEDTILSASVEKGYASSFQNPPTIKLLAPKAYLLCQ